MSDVVADISAKLGALGLFLLATHQHEACPDSEQPWLLRRNPAPCAACRELQAALEIAPAAIDEGQA